MTDIVILAAGKGTRMRSSLPKVLHKLAGKSFLQHVLDTVAKLESARSIIVVGHGAEQVQQAMAQQGLVFVKQKQQLGTGHAVQQALPELRDNEVVLILYGDVPLISDTSLNALIALADDQNMALLTCELEQPTGYGRIIRDNTGQVNAIVEQKDASAEQLQIREINTGVMAIRSAHLRAWLPTLSNDNAQSEYYLTDLISMAVSNGVQVQTVMAQSEMEISGVNSRLQQAQLERCFQLSQANELLEQGLSLADPARFDLRGELAFGEDCEIDINCIFEGQNQLGNNVTLGANCTLINAKIGDHVVIKANTVIESAEVADRAVIGPFARLRPGTQLKNGAKIGNFVETKQAVIGEGSKVNHLSYVGDAKLGANVNVGAGTITCNYDGANKSQTTIEDGAFIGSNSALVAPVTVGKNATVGAGSVVTKDSSDSQLVLSRAKQRNIDGWQRPSKK